MKSHEIMNIFVNNGIMVESGARFSVKGQMAQFVNSINEIESQTRQDQKEKDLESVAHYGFNRSIIKDLIMGID